MFEKSITMLRLQPAIKFRDIKLRKLVYGKADFGNQDSAIEYGIRRCQKALTTDTQFERGVGINESRVCYEINGTSNNIEEIPFMPEVFVHSHPDTYAKGCTTAPSSGDYCTFIMNPEMKKLLAVNSNGEYYELSKIPGFDFDKIDPMAVMGEFNICMDRTLFGHSGAPAAQRECLERCIATQDIEAYFNDFYRVYVKPQMYNMRNVSKTLVDKTHEFWVIFGEKFGVKIRTNFSNFSKNDIN